MNEGSKNVPFALPEEEEEEVFSSVEVERPEQSGFRTSGALPAVSGRGVVSGAFPAAGAVPHSGPRPVLTIETSGGQPRTVEVDRPNFFIGGPNSHLPLQDPFVSRWHVQLRQEGSAYILEDTGSLNGVFLRIADELQLEDRDEIILGQQRFVFRTSWDTPPAAAPGAVPAVGGDLPREPARLIQSYAGGVQGGIYMVGERLMVGRQNADVTEVDDPWLSSPHATIERRHGSFVIKDARSQYGTYVRVRDPVELIDGDSFIVGRSKISIRYP